MRDPHASPAESIARPDRQGPLASLIGGLRQWQLPTTVKGVHLLGVLPVVAVRVIAFFQLLLAVLSGPVHTLNPAVYWAAVAIFVVEGTYVMTRFIQLRTPAAPRLVLLDVTTMCALLLAQIVYAPPETRLSTWDAWGFGVSMSALVGVGIGFNKWWQTIAAACCLAAGYLISVGPSAFEQGHSATVLTNASGYLFNPVIWRLLWTYTLRLATEADAARLLAEQLARKAEREAQMGLLHDGISLLRDLAAPQSLTPEQRKILASQALAKVWELQQFLADVHVAPVSKTLGGILQAAVLPFKDLNPTVHVDLVRGLTLPEPTLRAVEAAVTTLLFNVRRHAHAKHCHLHGDTEAGRWEIVVRDDGVGFDPETTPWHHGLQSTVTSALHRVGVDVAVWSEPGNGTAVTLTGPVDPTL